MTRIPNRPLAASGLALLFLASGSLSAAAGDFGIRDEAFDDPQYDFKIDTELTAGRLSGTSHELVYDDGRKLSELIWTMDNAIVIGGKVSIRPSHWWSVEMSGYINADSEATMDDYDWLDPTRTDWTDWSHHEDTSLERALMIDLSTKLALWRTDYFDLLGIAGYRWDKFDWNAYGGSYIYSNFGFRDARGTFPVGELGISYKQEFQTPYVGLGGLLKLGDISVTGAVTGSWWVTADDVDLHHLRFLEFQEEFEGGEMLKYDLEGRYQLTDSLAVKGAWQHTTFEEMKGPTRVTTIGGTGGAYFPGESAGADNETDIISAGLVYTFR